MKSSLFLVFLISFSFSQADERKEWNKELKKLQEQCRKEVGVDDESYQNMMKTGHANESKRQEVEFVYCLALKEDFFDEKGNLKAANIEAHLRRMGIDEGTIEETMQSCKSLREPDDIALSATRYYECFADRLPRDVLIL
ncbi:uncharacterized protein LOC123308234 [Coccinella septempunctata]|uniref:uncharacterized protein LOC123308234 n=1 Tax=Coccinella septempunctata TaxID=41139 RepID=UPI001D08BF92|nr:uncharacterized protein LOC123308234 [Coccinella septempunctata]